MRRPRSVAAALLGDLSARRVARDGDPIVGFLHAVRDGDRGPRSRGAVDVRVLERELAWLRARGYAFAPLEDVLAHVRGARPLRRAFHLIVDDGYRSLYAHAYPLLRAEGVPFSAALVEESFRGRRLLWHDELRLRLQAAREKIEEVNAIAPELVRVSGFDAGGAPVYARNALKEAPNGERLAFMARLREACPALDEGAAHALEALTEEEARELRAAGVEFLCHTRTHPILSRVETAEELRLEVEPWDAGLLRPDVLVYPNGKPEDVDPRVTAAMREAGVEFGFTTVRGALAAGADPYRLPRIAVSATLAGLRGEFRALARLR